MAKSKFEYVAMVQQSYQVQNDRWINARVYAENHCESPWCGTGKRVCDTQKEAKMYIDWVVKKLKPTGKDQEITRRAGMVGYSYVVDTDSQERMEIVKFKIMRRRVTEFEVVKEWSKA